jgi:hypothetical protein
VNAANLLVNPDRPASAPWRLRESTQLHSLPQPSNGAILMTLSPSSGGTSQCVTQNLPQTPAEVDAAVTAMILENGGGVRGIVTAFPTADCSGQSLASVTLAPSLDTRQDAPNKAVRMTGVLAMPVGTRSVEYWIVAYHLVPTIPFVFSALDSVLNAKPEGPFEGPPDLTPAANSRPFSLRAGNAGRLRVIVSNDGDRPTSGPWTLTISATGVRIACPNPEVDCTRTASGDLVLTFDQPIDGGDFHFVEVLVDADSVLPSTQQITFTTSGGGDPYPSNNTQTTPLIIAVPRAGDFRDADTVPRLVTGRGRTTGGSR